MRNLIIALLLLTTLCGCSSSVERKALFDYDWQFRLEGDSVWQSVDLPHDWSIEGQFDQSNKMGDAGGYLPDGVGVYRKVFDLGNEYKDKKVMLYFEGCYMNTDVKVNGNDVGKHDYGYSSFAFDITPYLNIGGDNTVEVRVDNSNQQNCRWYSGSGIFRHVWLITTDKVHLRHWGNFITTPEVSESEATVRINAIVDNETDRRKAVVVRAEIPGAQTVEKAVDVPADSSVTVVLETKIDNPKLWSVSTDPSERANLYTAKISVLEGGKTLDLVTETFGVRSISYSVDEGFKLNGKPLKVFGGCLHHDNGILGAAAYDRAEQRKVEMMKAAGFNALRTSHNPVSEALLNVCDSLGIMVIDEAFDGWYAAKTEHGYHELIDDDWRDDIAALVLRDRNHPSVICWSIGNEIIERDSPEAVETAKRLGSLCRELDPTRPVTQALACWNDKWIGQDSLAAQHEVIGYNYLLDRASDDHQRVPDRIIWQTESFPRDVYRNWTLVNGAPYIIGDFVWTAIDYLGESSIGRWYYEGETPGEHYQGTHFPWHGAYCGDIDLTGWRKPVSYYRQMMFAPDTADDIYIAVKEPDGYHGQIRETSWSVWPTWESWNWSGWEGKPIEVVVYSKYPDVRLYLNGEEQTDRENNDHVLTTFAVPYAPGTLKAVGVVDGKEVGVATISTAGVSAALRLTPDRSVLTTDPQDLSFVTVEVIDKDGNVCPDAEIPFTAAIDGPAQIIAVGNANLQDTDPYKDLSHSTWKGRALLVIKSASTPGTSTLTLTPASSLPPTQSKIQIK